jgi:hypothetical protein
MSYAAKSLPQRAPHFDGVRFTATLALSAAIMGGVIFWLGQHTGLDSTQALQQAQKSVTQYCRQQSVMRCEARLVEVNLPAKSVLADAAVWEFRFQSTGGGVMTVQVDDRGRTHLMLPGNRRRF